MTKRKPAPKSRPVSALLIVVGTLFLLAGPRCGVLGALLSASVERLVGAAGTGLLVATAWCIAFILATPPGTLTRMVVALWRACTVNRQHSVVVVKTRAAEPSSPAPAAPSARRELQAVRDALKGLGYEKHEIEPLIATMDPAVGFEKNVKSALKALRVVN